MKKQNKQIDALPLIFSEKQKINHDLDYSEHMYRLIFEDSMDGLILWDHQHCIVDINNAGEKLFGISKNQLIGRSIFDPFNHFEKMKQEIKKHIEVVEDKGHHISTMIFDGENGKKLFFEYYTKHNIIDGLNFTVFKNVTEKMELEEHLRKSDRLNIIGELAAGIAHEIRNPMTALKGFIQLLETSIKEEHSMYYQVITSELARIDTIINEFLIIAKPQAIRFQEMNIIQIMKETLDLLNAQAVLYNVQFYTQFDEGLPNLYCEPNQLKKVFINLIKNAIEVMPNGGTILITIKRHKNNHLRISIQDEGMGIAKDKLNKLGEPFYTTKERGTGLGLMVSYRIIEEHKGSLRIESEEGRGSIFHITLPLGHKKRE